ncbi:MAG: HEAT repeat domain-containing protein [Pseudanabaenaceae cyanobacterium SKYGB_i_bin29]|nr:HEAT repeat domain-containing protein [Pseudanabaenaceae cyanobacterium SKYG29]MDW8422326.1 HEAT repeat domain-containing protein [Pseudanabaenaceae cyanobacterium SKYGB_i_bin29]
MNDRFLRIYAMTEAEAITLLDKPKADLGVGDVRYVAAAHLVNFNTPESRSALMRAVARKDDDLDNRIVRRKAAESLGKLQAKEAIPLLVACLGETDRYLVENCVWALGEMQVQEEEILAKIASLLTAQDQSYRVILQTLRKLGYQPAVPQVRKFVDHPDPGIASAALSALAVLDGDLTNFARVLDFLWHSSPMVRRMAIQDIVDAQYISAIPAIACAPVSLVFRVRGIKLLAETNSLPKAQYQSYLEQCLIDHPSTLRLLHKYNDMPSLDRLVQDLYDTDFGKCYLATLTILQHYPDVAGARLVEEFYTGEARNDYGAHYHVVKLIGWLKYTPGYDVLMEALHNTQPQFQKSRSGAAISLGELGDKRAIPELKKYLNSPIWELQYCAEMALQRLNGG